MSRPDGAKKHLQAPIKGKIDGGEIIVRESRYPEPDGYLKMRIRDFVAGAFVVSCLALAALVSHMWRNVLRKTGPRSRVAVVRLAKQRK